MKCFSAISFPDDIKFFYINQENTLSDTQGYIQKLDAGQFRIHSGTQLKKRDKKLVQKRI
jgi:hypothetical protein